VKVSLSTVGKQQLQPLQDNTKCSSLVTSFVNGTGSSGNTSSDVPCEDSRGLKPYHLFSMR